MHERREEVGTGTCRIRGGDRGWTREGGLLPSLSLPFFHLRTDRKLYNVARMHGLHVTCDTYCRVCLICSATALFGIGSTRISPWVCGTYLLVRVGRASTLVHTMHLVFDNPGVGKL